MKKSRSGFTLIELLLSMFIFSMVMGGLAVIYGTAYQQSFKMLRSSRLRQMGQISSRALQNEVTSATWLDRPAANDSSSHLRGYQNVVFVDNVLIPAINGDAGDNHWFHFCVSASPKPPCGDPQVQPKCLWYYSSTAWDGSLSSVPAIGDGECGSPAAGVTPQVLASWISAPVGGASNYFTRVPGDKVVEKNQIRANFFMMRPATEQEPLPIRVAMDTTYNMNFSPP